MKIFKVETYKTKKNKHKNDFIQSFGNKYEHKLKIIQSIIIIEINYFLVRSNTKSIKNINKQWTYNFATSTTLKNMRNMKYPCTAKNCTDIYTAYHWGYIFTTWSDQNSTFYWSLCWGLGKFLNQGGLKTPPLPSGGLISNTCQVSVAVFGVGARMWLWFTHILEDAKSTEFTLESRNTHTIQWKCNRRIA